MRALAIALVLVTAGCGGKRQVGPAGPPAVAAAFPAARWIPGNPTYVVAAKTMRDAQRAFRDLVDTFGMVVGAETGEIATMLTQMLAVDPMSAEAVAAIGIDLDGGMALFSEDVNPTFVVHVSSREALQVFFDRQRERGLITQSVIVEGSEIFSAKLDAQLKLSWTVADDWLWVHFTIGTQDDGTAWFTASRHPGTPAWGDKWDAAQKLATRAPGLVGIVALRELAAKLATRAPEAAACARQLEAVNGVGVAIEAEGNFVGGRVAVDLGSAALRLAQHVLAPPPGWATASAKAPLSAQWNIDLRVVAEWVQPCVARMQDDGTGPRPADVPNLAAMLDEYGVRSGRAFAHSIDPDDNSGVGVVALDLTHPRYFASLLGQIPMRSKFEKTRQFGAYKGKHLSVPFVATADYVLDDRVFIAAMGDGQLQRAATGAPAAPPPAFAIDLLPPGLSVGVWTWLFTEADLPNPKRLAQRLQTWNDIHFSAQIDRERLVIDAQGNRR
ncbi:MAG TPA: hypothetical protein VIV11_32030 [Kofleriaceae bacterium]